MRIVFITFYNSSDPREWSGIPNKMIEFLQKNKIEVLRLNNYHPNLWIKLILRIKKYFYKIQGKKYLFDRDLNYIRNLSNKINRDLNKIKNFDLILSPGTLPISFIQPKKPVFIWTDATFLGMLNYYPEFSNLSKETIRNGIFLERKSFEKAKKVIFSSEWALETALKLHGLPKEKGLVIKFGANFENILDKESTIDKFKAKRLDNKILTLLFVGVDWERKGGHIAERVTRILNEMGIDTKLEVVGIPSIKNSDFINSHGFLKIENPEQQLLLSNLFFKSHFFILPTKAECCAIVFCESSSFGLPIISYNTGGVSSAITNNENGFLFEPGTDAMELAIKIKELYFNRTQYIELCNNTYEHYQKNLNWDSAIKSFIKII